MFGIKDFSSIDEVTDRVLHDLVNGADLEVVESDKTEKQQVSTGSEEERGKRKEQPLSEPRLTALT